MMSRRGIGRTAVLRAALAGASLAALAGTAPAQQSGTIPLDTIDVEGRGTPLGGAGGSGAAPRLRPETAGGPGPGYVATPGPPATKTDTPLIRTPQSISVIGTEQIIAQKAQTLSEAVRYTPGVFANQFGPDTRLDWFIIR